MHNTTTKIRDYKSNELNELVLKIIKLSVICGTREPLDNDMARFIVKFLKDEFKDFSYEEIEEAFTKYIKGSLAETVNDYGVFSPKFVSSVLIDYKKLRNKELSLYYRFLEEEKMKQEAKEPTAEEIKEIEKELLENVLFKVYNKAMVENLPIELDLYNANICFWKFWNKGLIEVSPTDKTRFNLKAVKELTTEQKKLSEEKQQEVIREISIYYYFNEYLKVQKAKKIDLKEMYYF